MGRLLQEGIRHHLLSRQYGVPLRDLRLQDPRGQQARIAPRSTTPPSASPATATTTLPTRSPTATSASRWCPSTTLSPMPNPMALRSESKIQNCRDGVVFAI
nr:hypothetical protein Itr_chr11CG21780 [Ipomoea trifida]GME15276.1 hypothetical protein Iba_scaffold16049CG0030 [Ipomoea batatas]GME20570.1 hypothetical protein Iba_scaffold25487CG0050 [Ipomoea batatas]